MNRVTNFKFARIVCLGLFLFWLQSVYSAPGVPSDIPLYSGSGATPNVLWVLDDSRSMEGETLKRRSADDSSTGYPATGSCGFGSPEYADGCPIDPVGDTKTDLLHACAGYNTMAYLPSVTYTPWVDQYGVDFPIHDLTVTGNSLTNVPDLDLFGVPAALPINLSLAYYIVWNDDGDGEFDRGECWEDIAAAHDALDDSSSQDSVDHRVFVSSLSLTEQQNYVNWYMYYRSRTAVMKAILSPVFFNADDRFGLATINKDEPVATQIGEMTTAAHKQNILSRLLQVDADTGSTPLEYALGQAGRYYHQNDSLSPDLDFVHRSGDTLVNPIIESCQANYTIMVTDGYARNDTNVPLGNVDGGTDNGFNLGPYADSLSDTIADVAMYYYSADLDSLLADNVTSNNPRDTNNAQHMVTYALAFGVQGNIDISPVMVGGVPTPRPIAEAWTSVSNSWPTTIGINDPTTLDDLYHATFNGRGEFFSSSDPVELRRDIQTILESIASANEGTAAALGVNSTSISTDSTLFQAWFSTEGWTGELRAYDYASGVLGSIDWEASQVLDARDLTAAAAPGLGPRVLLTYSSPETSGILFDAPADYTSPATGELNAQHIADLELNTAVNNALTTTEKQAALENLIDWFKGDRTNEGTMFRPRGSLLGDIVSSSPQYVGDSAENYPNYIEGSANPYFDYVSTKSSKTPVVYVGSNDGMLHGFNANNGRELFAYLPEALFTTQANRGYHSLAELGYSHVPYVDGTASVADVFVNSAWRTYLVGTLNGGGKGIFVLDVSNPVTKISGAQATDIVVAEFTHANLGYTYARAQIGRLNNGKWAAIFGNGYNNTGHGQASLFIYYLDGSGYVEIPTGVGSIVSSDCEDPGSDCNGLSAPSIIDLNNDGNIDRVYAGDVHGNMWAFDLLGSSPGAWGIAHNSDLPLFTACRGTLPCAVANRQPITSKPVVVSHKTEFNNVNTYPNLMVLFGTGQYLTTSDPTTTATESLYGVWDAGPVYGGLDKSDLVGQAITLTATTDINGDAINIRNLTTNTVDYDETALTDGFGWYIDMTSGERNILTPIVSGNHVAFVTSIPDTGTCQGGGSGWLMLVNILSGRSPTFSVFNNITNIASGVPLQNLSGGMITLGDKFIGADAVGNIEQIQFSLGTPRSGQRSSWSIVK